MCDAAIALRSYLAELATSPSASWADFEPWQITLGSQAVVRQLLEELNPSEYVIDNEIAVHNRAVVETGAVLKGPLILGAGVFVAPSAYLCGGNWLAERCTVGPCSELKSSFLFSGTKLAHFNSIGDSIFGSDVNLEAGSVICNYRNERSNREIRVCVCTTLHRTGVDKFGALIGDGSRIGANAVVAPGALLTPGSIVRRGALRDVELEVSQ